MLLRQQWPDYDAEALAHAVRYLLPLAQLPPRGIWGLGGLATWATVESWLGRPLDAVNAPDQMVLRYLAAFGPATVKDVQAWSWLTRQREVIERLRPQVRVFRDEQGNELFDLPEAPRPDPDTPAPPRFLPEYDNVLLSHAERGRIIAPDHCRLVFTKGAVLVDGFVRAAWTIKRRRSSATLVIEQLGPLSSEERNAVQEEGMRLLEFAATGADHDIQLTTAVPTAGDSS